AQLDHAYRINGSDPRTMAPRDKVKLEKIIHCRNAVSAGTEARKAIIVSMALSKPIKSHA
ncbi:hypothetical protein PJP07_31300, partial [Mycobacterium kansasii]